MPLDQTYGWLPKTYPVDDHTIVHSEAMLYDTRERAESILHGLPEAWWADVYEVVDEAEFVTRKDTW